MRPTALLERYRFALEVIANGVEWEPGTKTARLALLPPEVSAESLAIGLDMAKFVDEVMEEEPASAPGMSGVCEDGLHTLCGGCKCVCHGVIGASGVSVNEADDEPEPIDLAEIDEELDAEEGPVEKPADPVSSKRWIREKLGADGLTETHRAILSFVRERGEVTVAMIRAEIPRATEDKTKRGLKILKERGLIVPEGDASARTFKPVAQRSEAREATEAGKQRAAEEREARAAAVKQRSDENRAAAGLPSQDKPTMPEEPASEKVADAGTKHGPNTYELTEEQHAVKRNGPGSDEGRLLESVGFKPNWSIAQHAGRLDLHQDRVARAMRKLEDEGEVRSSPVGGRVVWNLR